ncbi:MAG: hypothetical protein ACR2P0_15355 [Acidimicrobiales bacterium]
MALDELTRGVHLAPGDGIVARVGSFVAFAQGDDDGLNQLVVRLNSLAAAEWSEVVRTITADIAAADFNGHPALACAHFAADRVSVLVYGEMTLTCATALEERRFDGSDSSTWIDLVVHGTPTRVHCGSRGESGLVGLLRDGVVPSGGFLFDPSVPFPAVVEWAGVPAVTPAEAVDTSEPPPLPPSIPHDDHDDESATDEYVPDTEERLEEILEVLEEIEGETPRLRLVPTPDLDHDDNDDESSGLFTRLSDMHKTASPTDGEPGENHLGLFEELADDGPTAEKGSIPALTDRVDGGSLAALVQTAETTTPQLHGVRCPNGHLNSIRDNHCRTCGEAPDADADIEIGNRPTIATITFDDGVVLPLDRPAVVGSGVPDSYEIGDEPATVVRLTDADDAIAAVQLEVHLVGWDVEVVDIDPAHSAYIRLAGETQSRTRLRPGQPTALPDGAEVEMGGRSFRLTIGPPPT